MSTSSSICKGCKGNFPRRGALSLHQMTCPGYRTYAQKQIATGKRKAEEFTANPRAKAPRIDGGGMQTAEDGGLPGVGDFDEAGPAAVAQAALPLEPLPPPELRPSGRVARPIKLPKRFHQLPDAPKRLARVKDILPPSPPGIAPDAEEEAGNHSNMPTPTLYRTAPDAFGVWREYLNGRPSFSPDVNYSLSQQSNITIPASATATDHGATSNLEESALPDYAPFKNASTHMVMDWYYGSGTVTKSQAELQLLVDDVILHPSFKPSELEGFSIARELKRMDKHQASIASGKLPSLDKAFFDDRWHEGTVYLSLPCDGFKFANESDAPQFPVKFHYRKLLDVVKEAFREPAAEHFHHEPFKTFWKPTPDAVPERIYGENLTGDYFNAEHDKIRTKLREKGIEDEVVVAGLMIWSDATCLAQFGTQQLWPIYLQVGNQSKYARGSPESFASHHLAYLPKLGDDLHEFYFSHFGKEPTAATLTHLRRELAQAIWTFLLDSEFIHAYVHGEHFKFIDEIIRLLVLRLNTYSADYPEKMLMACLKFLAQCLCPRCLVLKNRVPLIGSKTDTRDRCRLERVDSEHRQFDVNSARRLIYSEGMPVNGVGVDRILGEQSMTPTRNAFSERLLKHGFNFYQMFVPDLLHEFELGVWKAVFTHLMRILWAHGKSSITALNKRYHQVSPFGRDTIRPFPHNVADMKKLAGRDFEDMLQCALPIFEGLLPSGHCQALQRLLFELATWHALAKLRLHTEKTLCELDASSTRLGIQLRYFLSNVCPAYDTTDLPAEINARGRRESATKAKRMAKDQQSASAPVQAEVPPPGPNPGVSKRPRGRPKKNTAILGPPPTQASSSATPASAAEEQLPAVPTPAPLTDSAPKPKVKKLLNLQTYKVHALGAYARAIRQHGTTDNYSTQLGELEHKRPKRHYHRVSKSKHIYGISQHVSRERRLHVMRSRKAIRDHAHGNERMPALSLEVHHQISAETRNRLHLPTWLKENEDDPCLKDFEANLKGHLLSRLLGKPFDGDDVSYTAKERNTVGIRGLNIYRHNLLKVNYTTYDMRRDQDVLNPRKHSDVIVMAHEDSGDDQQTYWYARIIGIFHAVVVHSSSQARTTAPQHMEFLFVRWYGRDPDWISHGFWKEKCLPRVGFVPFGEDHLPFGFLDPACVLRGAHLIPAFVHGKTSSRLPPSKIARRPLEGDEDWENYYVNMFVDRDMFMRFRGGGIGHLAIRDDLKAFASDRDPLDIQYLAQRNSPGAPINDDDEDLEAIALDSNATADRLGEDLEEDDSGSEDDGGSENEGADGMEEPSLADAEDEDDGLSDEDDLGVMSTPRSVRTDGGDVANDNLRVVVAHNMNTEMLECKMPVYLDHYGASKVDKEFIDGCKAHLKRKRYLLNDGTWKHFQSAPASMDGTENNCFAPLGDIVKEIFDYATSTGKRENNYIFKMVPNTRLSSDVPGSNHMMDAGILEEDRDEGPFPHHIMIMPVEVKQGKLTEDTKVGREQIVGDCHHIFADDPRRMFIYAITIVSMRMTAWYFSRSHSIKSNGFDWMHGEGLDQFIQLMLSFAFATPEGLGMDPSVHKSPSALGEGQQYVYEVEQALSGGPVQPSTDMSPKAPRPVLRSDGRSEKQALAAEGKEMLYFRTVRIISRERPLCITGRMTRIWVVQQVEHRTSFRFIPGSKEVILKDVWIDSDDRSETENVRDILHAVDRFVDEGLKKYPGPDAMNRLIENDPRFREFSLKTKKRLAALLTDKKYHAMFLTTLYEWEGKETKPLPLPDDNGVARVRVPTDPVFLTALKTGSIGSVNRNSSRHNPVNPSMQTHGEVVSEEPYQRGYSEKTQRRFVYQEICTPSYNLKKLGDVVDVIRQALDALQILYCARWVHRDISVGNILAMESVDANGKTRFKIKLSDFEFAQPAGTTRHRSDPRTGTPFFMPAEIMRGRYVFPVARRKPDDEEELDEAVGGMTLGDVKAILERAKVEDIDAPKEQGHAWGLTPDHPLFKRLQPYDPQNLLPLPSTISDDLPDDDDVVTYNYQHDLESIWWILLYFITMLANNKTSEDYATKTKRWFIYDSSSDSRTMAISTVLDPKRLRAALAPDLKIIFPTFLEELRGHLWYEYLKKELYGLLEDDTSYSRIHGKFAQILDLIMDTIPHSSWAQLEVKSSKATPPPVVHIATTRVKRKASATDGGNSKKRKP